MEVESYEPPFRFLVTSSSRGSSGLKFLVDLSDHDCNGSCSCEHFSMTLINEVRKGHEVVCKHISAADKVWAKWMKRKVKDTMEKHK